MAQPDPMLWRWAVMLVLLAGKPLPLVAVKVVRTPRYKINTESGGAASIAIGAKALSKGALSKGALSTAIGVQSSSSGVAPSAFGIGASASEKCHGCY